jgi:hypothetical protein
MARTQAERCSKTLPVYTFMSVPPPPVQKPLPQARVAPTVLPSAVTGTTAASAASVGTGALPATATAPPAPLSVAGAHTTTLGPSTTGVAHLGTMGGTQPGQALPGGQQQIQHAHMLGHGGLPRSGMPGMAATATPTTTVNLGPVNVDWITNVIRQADPSIEREDKMVIQVCVQHVGTCFPIL